MLDIASDRALSEFLFVIFFTDRYLASSCGNHFQRVSTLVLLVVFNPWRCKLLFLNTSSYRLSRDDLEISACSLLCYLYGQWTNFRWTESKIEPWRCCCGTSHGIPRWEWNPGFYGDSVRWTTSRKPQISRELADESEERISLKQPWLNIIKILCD